MTAAHDSFRMLLAAFAENFSARPPVEGDGREAESGQALKAKPVLEEGKSQEFLDTALGQLISGRGVRLTGFFCRSFESDSLETD